MIERVRPYHQTIAVIFASRLLQLGDDQRPHTADIGYNVQEIRQTQVVSQDCLHQSGPGRHPIMCLSAFQPIDYEFGHGKPIQTTEHTGSRPLHTAFEQTKIKTWVVN